jgi:hypothetical protein
MCHVFCYKKLVIGINPRIQARKGLISYYKTNGITFLEKHVDVDHSFIAQIFEEEMNSLLTWIKERWPSKKIMNPFGGSIFNFFLVKDTLKKKDVSQKEFLEDLGFLIVKNNLPIQFVESMRLKCVILCVYPKLNFPSRRQFSQDISP